MTNVKCSETLRVSPKPNLSTPLIAAVFLASGLQVAQASVKEKPTLTEQLVVDTLHQTEEAISLIRVNPESAKSAIQQAIVSIENIKSYYTHNTVTHAATNKPGKTTAEFSYQHYYPKVDMQLLDEASSLPTLRHKLNSNILYEGSPDAQPSATSLYFDYTFAMASLITAREAVDANHSLEALANLKRTFEAIYVNPDFKVTYTNP